MQKKPSKPSKPIVVYRWKKAVAPLLRPTSALPPTTKPTVAELRKQEKNRKERDKWLNNVNRYFDRSTKKNTNE